MSKYCSNCKHEDLDGECLPCVNCDTIEHWKPKIEKSCSTCGQGTLHVERGYCEPRGQPFCDISDYHKWIPKEEPEEEVKKTCVTCGHDGKNNPTGRATCIYPKILRCNDDNGHEKWKPIEKIEDEKNVQDCTNCRFHKGTWYTNGITTHRCVRRDGSYFTTNPCAAFVFKQKEEHPGHVHVSKERDPAMDDLYLCSLKTKKTREQEEEISKLREISDKMWKKIVEIERDKMQLQEEMKELKLMMTRQTDSYKDLLNDIALKDHEHHLVIQ